MPIEGLKTGDLVGIPWRVAFALQADGWTLRRDNIWAKDNPMPESVNGWRWEQHTVASGSPQGGEKSKCPGCEKCSPNGGLVLRKGNWRCTSSHEYVFQFSKSDSYFCNAEAAREKGAQVRPEGENSRMHRECTPNGDAGKPNSSKSAVRASGNKKRFIAGMDILEHGRLNNHMGSGVPWVGFEGDRNKRSVWQIATAPYRDAHFATFPPALVRPIIEAATSIKCCAECGAPWAPVIERGEPNLEHQKACGGDGNGEYHGEAIKDFDSSGAENASDVKARILAGMVEKKIVDWRKTCDCRCQEIVPATGMDIFGGSGTFGAECLKLGRKAILIDLNTDYIKMMEKRTSVNLGLALG